MAFKRSFAVLFVLASSVLASSSGPDTCNKSEFWYPTKSCCLPHGGPPKPPSPPPGKACPPTTWYWHTQKSCCVPNHPPPENPPPPQCSRGWDWNHATQCCEPGSGSPTYPPIKHKPSQVPGHKHGKGDEPPYQPEPPKYEPPQNEPPKYVPPKSQPPNYQPPNSAPPSNPYGGSNGYKKRSAAPLCPHHFEACPLTGLTGNEYECLDTTAELRSCGGCASTGKGEDCNLIEGAWNVGCEAGSCAVYTCALGYKVAHNGKSCVKN